MPPSLRVTVVAPGSVNYAVLGPVSTLPPEMLKRKYIVHNSFLTLVRLSTEEIERRNHRGRG
jgi:uncharacterized protein (UPF0261 family)